jgi:hypothetical protein
VEKARYRTNTYGAVFKVQGKTLVSVYTDKLWENIQKLVTGCFLAGKDFSLYSLFDPFIF